MDKTTHIAFGDLLRTFRRQRKMTQHAVASRIGVHRNTIGSWEQGSFLPESKTIVLELAYQLQLETHETQQLLEASLVALSPYWSVPYQRNLFFTGRESVLHQLHAVLAHKHTAVLSQSYSLNGLGGIGKTQTAIEYAYRYANDYSAVFWINAETEEGILSSLISIATLLNLPEKQELPHEKVVAAVIRWLTNHREWLLIFDNVSNPALVRDLLPPARGGALLFTSRIQAPGLAIQTMNLEPMEREEGIRFLLHRARLLDPINALHSLLPENVSLAQEIVTVMDGLPLALDQAGAYIETTRCSLSDFLVVFQSAPINLLNERESYRDHPHSVVRTFLLSFEQIQRTNQSAIELLTACAFLAPDEIPEELLIEGAISLGPTFERMALNPFLFNSALKDLFAYSLIQRNTEKKMLSMHRLVQVVLKGRIEDAVQQEWAHRTIRAVNQAFPDNEELALWPHCQHYMLQVEACWTLIDQWNIVSVEAGHLLYRAGSYTLECAHYAQAERLLKKSLLIREDAFGVGHIVVSPNLKDLAWLYYEQGKYSEAEALLLRTLTLQEQQLCPDHLDIARSLNILALIYRARGQYSEAEALLLRALALQEQQLPPDHLDIARSLNNLALIYRAQGQYSKAEPLVLRALTIREQQLDPDHINIANSLNNLAKLSILQGRYNEAEPLLHRVLSILRRHIGAEHPLVAFSLHNLALLYQKQQLYDLAEQFHTQALVIREKALGQKHPDVANSLLLLAELALEQGHRMEAKKLYQRAIHIQELVLGSESSIVLKTKKECNAIFSSSNDGNFTSHPSSAKREKGIRSGAQRRGTDGAQRSDDLSCPQCKQKNKVVSSGENRSGSRRFRCLLCQQYFTPHMVPKGYDFVLKSRAVLLVQEGYSYRATARELGVDHHTVSRWLTREKITSTVIGDD